jgi:hypothetical protein
MPCFQARSIAWASGSTLGSWVESVPKDRFRTLMLRPLSFLCSATQSTAAMIWEMSVAPVASAALRLTRRASGAMPRKLSLSPA